MVIFQDLIRDGEREQEFVAVGSECLFAVGKCLDHQRSGHSPLFKGGVLLLGCCIQRSNWVQFYTPTSFTKKKMSTVLSINCVPTTLKSFWIGVRIHVCQVRAAESVIETFDARQWEPTCCPIMECGWVRSKVFTTERAFDVVVAHGDHLMLCVTDYRLRVIQNK
jgi:hypothetical protein